MYLQISVMNESISHVLEFAVAALLTMTALAYTFWSMTEWPDYFELVPSAATVYVEQTAIPEEVPWTGTQVVAKLYQLSEDEIPITVDGFTFFTEVDVINHQNSISQDGQYSWEVTLDENGLVSEIIFMKGE